MCQKDGCLQNSNMKFIVSIIIVCLTIQANYCKAQNDTLVKKSVRGLYFIPAYHFLYDYKKCCPGEIIPAYHDYFFPTEIINIDLLKDSNIEISFKNCIRIEMNNFHEKVKVKAIQLNCIDTTTIMQWYYLDTFYIVPVEIDYKVFKDDFPKMMSQDSFAMQVTNGAKIYFYPKREAMLPINIKILSEATLPQKVKKRS